jgi:hypothetical protein
MRVFRVLLPVAVSATMAVTGLAPAAQASTELDFHAGLNHSRAYPYAHGSSDYERHGTAREVEVTVHHLGRLAGKRVTVYVNYKRVGTMLVNRYGNAHREWKTAWGQYVPYATAGSPIRVRTASGTLVVSGWYHREYDD